MDDLFFSYVRYFYLVGPIKKGDPNSTITCLVRQDLNTRIICFFETERVTISMVLNKCIMKICQSILYSIILII
jgi:hypothetical protein